MTFYKKSVNAILEKKKTTTHKNIDSKFKCPYKIGDYIWVKEKFAASFDPDGDTTYPYYYKATHEGSIENNFNYLLAQTSESWHTVGNTGWINPKFMKKHESRITLKITQVNVKNDNMLIEFELIK